MSACYPVNLDYFIKASLFTYLLITFDSIADLFKTFINCPLHHDDDNGGSSASPAMAPAATPTPTPTPRPPSAKRL